MLRSAPTDADQESLILSIAEEDDSSDGNSSSASSEDSEDDSDDSDDELETKDSLGVVPLVLAIVVLVTCIGTVLWGCRHPRIDCKVDWPTVASAARFHPQSSLFTIGLVLSGLLSLTTLLLFHWHARITLVETSIATSATLVAGLVLVASMFAVAFWDSRSYSVSYTNGTIVLLNATLATIGGICLVRRRIVQKRASGHRLQRLQEELVIPEAFAVAATACFVAYAVANTCVNNPWMNPFGLFRPTHAAFAEYAAIVLAVSFGCTLRKELASLSDAVEQQYELMLRRTK
ncbi:unnamed protein product [Aphanomyces euteiches]